MTENEQVLSNVKNLQRHTSFTYQRGTLFKLYLITREERTRGESADMLWFVYPGCHGDQLLTLLSKDTVKFFLECLKSECWNNFEIQTTYQGSTDNNNIGKVICYVKRKYSDLTKKHHTHTHTHIHTHIHTCLLYTSPSPRDRTTSRMPSSA